CIGGGRNGSSMGCGSRGRSSAGRSSRSYRALYFRPTPARARQRSSGRERRAGTIIVASGDGRTILPINFPSFCRQHDEYTEGGKCGDLHALLLGEIRIGGNTLGQIALIWLRFLHLREKTPGLNPGTSQAGRTWHWVYWLNRIIVNQTNIPCGGI